MIGAMLLFIIYAIISTTGLILLKITKIFSHGFIAGGVMYLVGAVLWIYILRIYPISAAYPVASGALLITTSISGAMILNESFSIIKTSGYILIVIGAALIFFEPY